MLKKVRRLYFPSLEQQMARELPATFHERRAIMVHVPKAAGSSVAQALFGHDFGHRTIMDYARLDRKAVGDYFTFAFVRDPQERLLSAFRFMQKGGNTQSNRDFAATHSLADIDFPTFVVRLMAEPALQNWVHFQPQHSFLVGPANNILVRFVGRFENLQADFRHIANRMGVDAALPHSNRTERQPETVDTATATRIRSFYEADYRMFGY